MKMCELIILTAVEQDNGLMELMLQSIYKFTKIPFKIIICDNTNGKNKNRIGSIIGGKNNIEVVKNKPTLLGGSNRHGQALNKIFQMVDTKYTAILDSDVVVLSEDWYKIDSRYSIKASLKNGVENKYHMCFFVFETNKLKKQFGVGRIVDFMPGRVTSDRHNNKNYKPAEDVGWDICNFVKPSYIQFVEFVDCKSGNGQLFDASFQSDEFWVDGKLIAAHFGRGSNIGGKAVRKGFKHPREQLSEWRKVAEEFLNKCLLR